MHNRILLSEFEFKIYFTIEFYSLDTNLALYKQATLSNEWASHTPAEKAVDGILVTNENGCAIAGKQAPDTKLFLRVDLGKTSMISSVALQNRPHELTWYRMNPFDVMIGDSLANEGFDNPKCVDKQSFTQLNQHLRIDCPYIMTGRYVVVTNYHPQRYLEICELEVYGWQ